MVIKYRTEKKDFKPSLVREQVYADVEDNVDSSIKVCDMMNYLFHLDRLTEEHCYMLCINVKGKVIGIFEISHGSLTETIVNPREIFMKALLLGSYGIVLVHNHPSGDPTPSDLDRATCNRIYECCSLLGLTLQDFIIIGGNYHVSFYEQGLLRKEE